METTWRQRQAIKEASDWLARLMAGPSDADRAAFLRWFDRSPAHKEAYEQACATWVEAGMADAASLRRLTEMGDGPAQAAPVTRRWAPAMALAAAVVLAVFVGTTYFSNRAGIYETAIGERRDVVLADGSRVTLNTGTRLSVRGRSIQLERGEAYFEVAHDPSQPFIVTTSAGAARAVGTAFDIRSINDARSLIVVTDGRVELTAPSQTPVQIAAGSAAEYGAPGITPRAVADVDSTLAWRRGRLVFRQAALRDVVREINRYSETPIIIGDPSIEQLEINGVFATDRIPDLVTALTRAGPVRVERRADGAQVLTHN